MRETSPSLALLTIKTCMGELKYQFKSSVALHVPFMCRSYLSCAGGFRSSNPIQVLIVNKASDGDVSRTIPSFFYALKDLERFLL